MAPTARVNRANSDCSPWIPLGNLPPATEKCLWPRAGRAHSWKRGSAIPADRYFPEDLEISLAWVGARCLPGNSLSHDPTLSILTISISYLQTLNGPFFETMGLPRTGMEKLHATRNFHEVAVR